MEPENGGSPVGSPIRDDEHDVLDDPEDVLDDPPAGATFEGVQPKCSSGVGERESSMGTTPPPASPPPAPAECLHGHPEEDAPPAKRSRLSAEEDARSPSVGPASNVQLAADPALQQAQQHRHSNSQQEVSKSQAEVMSKLQFTTLQLLRQTKSSEKGGKWISMSTLGQAYKKIWGVGLRQDMQASHFEGLKEGVAAAARARWPRGFVVAKGVDNLFFFDEFESACASAGILPARKPRRPPPEASPPPPPPPSAPPPRLIGYADEAAGRLHVERLLREARERLGGGALLPFAELAAAWRSSSPDPAAPFSRTVPAAAPFRSLLGALEALSPGAASPASSAAGRLVLRLSEGGAAAGGAAWGARGREGAAEFAGELVGVLRAVRATEGREVPLSVFLEAWRAWTGSDFGPAAAAELRTPAAARALQLPTNAARVLCQRFLRGAARVAPPASGGAEREEPRLLLAGPLAPVLGADAADSDEEHAPAPAPRPPSPLPAPSPSSDHATAPAPPASSDPASAPAPAPEAPPRPPRVRYGSAEAAAADVAVVLDALAAEHADAAFPLASVASAWRRLRSTRAPFAASAPPASRFTSLLAALPALCPARVLPAGFGGGRLRVRLAPVAEGGAGPAAGWGPGAQGAPPAWSLEALAEACVAVLRELRQSEGARFPPAAFADAWAAWFGPDLPLPAAAAAAGLPGAAALRQAGGRHLLALLRALLPGAVAAEAAGRLLALRGPLAAAARAGPAAPCPALDGGESDAEEDRALAEEAPPSPPPAPAAPSPAADAGQLRQQLARVVLKAAHGAGGTAAPLKEIEAQWREASPAVPLHSALREAGLPGGLSAALGALFGPSLAISGKTFAITDRFALRSAAADLPRRLADVSRALRTALAGLPSAVTVAELARRFERALGRPGSTNAALGPVGLPHFRTAALLFFPRCLALEPAPAAAAGAASGEAWLVRLLPDADLEAAAAAGLRAAERWAQAGDLRSTPYNERSLSGDRNRLALALYDAVAAAAGSCEEGSEAAVADVAAAWERSNQGRPWAACVAARTPAGAPSPAPSRLAEALRDLLPGAVALHGDRARLTGPFRRPPPPARPRGGSPPAPPPQPRPRPAPPPPASGLLVSVRNEEAWEPPPQEWVGPEEAAWAYPLVSTASPPLLPPAPRDAWPPGDPTWGAPGGSFPPALAAPRPAAPAAGPWDAEVELRDTLLAAAAELRGGREWRERGSVALEALRGTWSEILGRDCRIAAGEAGLRPSRGLRHVVEELSGGTVRVHTADGHERCTFHQEGGR